MLDDEPAFDKLLDSLGAETLLDNLVRALTADERRENFDYIARAALTSTFPTAKARRERGTQAAPPLISRASAREPISHARQSPSVIHVPLGVPGHAPRVPPIA